jgi:hypothetical protein
MDKFFLEGKNKIEEEYNKIYFIFLLKYINVTTVFCFILILGMSHTQFCGCMYLVPTFTYTPY